MSLFEQLEAPPTKKVMTGKYQRLFLRMQLEARIWISQIKTPIKKAIKQQICNWLSGYYRSWKIFMDC